MNFKGTTNIPRDQVKGIIEQFGGSWNGYTWIDQTTYLETATRDALDRMLFIESERMAQLPLPSGRLRVGAHGHHLRAAGRRERSRSAARSGADRDRVQGAPVPASDDRLAVRSADDDPRRSVRLLPPLLRPQQRHARRSSATWTPTRRCGGSSSTSAASRRAPRRRALRTVEPEQTGERRVTIRKEGTTAYLKVGVSRAGGRPIRRFFPLLRARRRADRREGPEPVVAASACRRRSAARGCIARSSSAAWRRRCPARCCRPSSRFSTPCRRRRPKARRSRRSRRRCSRSSIACAATASPTPELDEGEGAAAGAAGVRQRQRHEHRAPARLLRDHRQRRRCSRRSRRASPP